MSGLWILIENLLFIFAFNLYILNFPYLYVYDLVKKKWNRRIMNDDLIDLINFSYKLNNFKFS